MPYGNLEAFWKRSWKLPWGKYQHRPRHQHLPTLAATAAGPLPNSMAPATIGQVLVSGVKTRTCPMVIWRLLIHNTMGQVPVLGGQNMVIWTQFHEPEHVCTWAHAHILDLNLTQLPLYMECFVLVLLKAVHEPMHACNLFQPRPRTG